MVYYYILIDNAKIANKSKTTYYLSYYFFGLINNIKFENCFYY